MVRHHDRVPDITYSNENMAAICGMYLLQLMYRRVIHIASVLLYCIIYDGNSSELFYNFFFFFFAISKFNLQFRVFPREHFSTFFFNVRKVLHAIFFFIFALRIILVELLSHHSDANFQFSPFYIFFRVEFFFFHLR